MYKSDFLKYESSLDNWEKKVAPLVRNPYLKDPKYFVDNPDSREHIFLDSKNFQTI